LEAVAPLTPKRSSAVYGASANLFLPQGADASTFLGDLQVAADRVGANHVRVRKPNVFSFMVILPIGLVAREIGAYWRRSGWRGTRDFLAVRNGG
jgi:hypothetical protein